MGEGCGHLKKETAKFSFLSQGSLWIPQAVPPSGVLCSAVVGVLRFSIQTVLWGLCRPVWAPLHCILPDVGDAL